MYSTKFIQYIQFEKRYSTHTVEAYSSDLKQFFTYIKLTFEIDNITEIQSTHIRSWIVALMESKMLASSVNRKITSLKTYYRFLLREKEIILNPMEKIISPRKVKSLPLFVEKEKMDMLVDFEVDDNDEFVAIRNRLIVELFYATGIRLSELINLKAKDVSISNQTIKVLGKGNKERIIPFYPELIKSIKKYIIQKEAISLTTDNFFTTKKGDKVYAKLVYDVVNKHLSAITTLDKKSPHVLRHTFATHMLNNGAEINAIKELLGHANLAATQIYTHNTFEKLLSIYKQAHPKS